MGLLLLGLTQSGAVKCVPEWMQVIQADAGMWRGLGIVNFPVCCEFSVPSQD